LVLFVWLFCLFGCFVLFDCFGWLFWLII